MYRHLTKLATLTVMATGMVFAQTSSGTVQPAPGKAAAGPRARMHHRMIQALNLTADQKQQAKSIFQAARQTAAPLRTQMKANRESLAAAVKADNAAQIQQLATAQGSLRGQLLSVRADAMAKFYATLTPDQRAKADQIHAQMKQRIQQRTGQGNNG
jgi:Spy/CpxP family protein refolding chaperone